MVQTSCFTVLMVHDGEFRVYAHFTAYGSARRTAGFMYVIYSQYYERTS